MLIAGGTVERGEKGEAEPAARAVAEAAQRVFGAAPRAVRPLAGGLSTRLFYRVELPAPAPRRVVARVERPEDPARRPRGLPPEPPLEPTRTLLAEAGIPVPASHGSDTTTGITFLEDLGDLSLERAAGAWPDRRTALYRSVLRLVPRLQGLRPGSVPLPAFRRRLGPELLRYKAEFFVEHALPVALRRPATATEAARVRAVFSAIAAELEDAPRRLAHRDLQSRNVHLVPTDGAGAPGGRPAPEPPARLRPVLLDFQGAFLAPPEYDAVCLLRDSYVELPEGEWLTLAEELRTELPDAPDPELFHRRFDLITVARKAKDYALLFYSRAGQPPPAVAPGPAARALQRAVARLSRGSGPFSDFADLLAGLPEERPR